MSDYEISVRDLRDYWKYYDELKDGEIITRYIPSSHMPAWHRICSGLEWTLYKADGGYFSKKRHRFCGVYRLFGLNSDNARDAATINRLVGHDDTGTLYIGEAGRMNARLNQLRRSFRREETHGAVRRWQDSELLKSRFPKERLAIAILWTTVRMHQKIEGDLIRAYLNSFGDTPPLNCSY
jgi:hypothetical protein